MKKILIIAAALLAAVSCAPSQKENEPMAEHVFLIGFDGWGSYCMDTVKMPNTRALMAEGAYTLQKRTVLPSDSAPNWCAMFCGAPAEFSGWSNNGDGPDVVPVYTNANGVFPTMFSLLREQKPESKIACVYEWGGIKPLIDPKAHDFEKQENPANIAAVSSEYIKAEKPNLMAIIYDDPDHVGHSKGHDSPEYHAKMEELDACLGEIIAAIKEAGIYEESIIIVTSDHGGIGGGHGGRSLMEMDTPFIIAGKNVKKIGEFKEYMMQYDTAHTVAEALGLTVPQVWNGQSMSQVFNK